MQTSSPKSYRARIAGRLLCLARWGTLTYFAAMLANRRIVASLAWMTSMLCAFVAGRISGKTNIPTSNRAPVRVVRVSRLKRKAPVYELTVNDAHVFYANGVLVSNCIDSLRYALEGLRRSSTLAKPLKYPSLGLRKR